MRIIRVAFAHTVTIPGAALNNVSEDSKEATNLRWVVSEPNLGTGLVFIDKRGMRQFVPWTNVTNVQFEDDAKKAR